MNIAVIDGQGGGIGKRIIEVIRAKCGSEVSIIALGTNSLATSQMLKAGADMGATGENAIIVNTQKVDVIVGVMGILIPDALLGELTQDMVLAIGRSDATKYLIPYNKCNVKIMGVKEQPIASYIEALADVLKSKM